MSRKSDEEILEEIKAKRKVKEAEEEVEKYKAEPYEDEEEEKDDGNDKIDKSNKKVPTQIIEREINLSLINDKLNYIISKLQEK